MRYFLSAGAALVLAASPAVEAGDAHMQTASVAAADFQNALPGAYSDSIALSLLS